MSGRKLAANIMFYKLDNLIYQKEISEIFKNVSGSMFSEKFNECSLNALTVEDLCLYYFALFGEQYDMECIYEFVGRMVEFAMSHGAVSYEENTIHK